jgi:hypothetical protein
MLLTPTGVSPFTSKTVTAGTPAPNHVFTIPGSSTALIVWNKTRASTIWAPTFIVGIFINNASGALRDAAFFAYADNYLIHVKFGIIMDVEASRTIRQAEVGVSQTILVRTQECFAGIDPGANHAVRPSAGFAYVGAKR